MATKQKEDTAMPKQPTKTAGRMGVAPSPAEKPAQPILAPDATGSIYDQLDAAALADLAGDVVAQGRAEGALNNLSALVQWCVERELQGAHS